VCVEFGQPSSSDKTHGLEKQGAGMWLSVTSVYEMFGIFCIRVSV
jgi:hypothetical protein